MLLAPLGKKPGGYGLCASAEGRAVFADTSDPDYQKILLAIADAKKWLDEAKRFDMPGFRPRQDWVREMKRYGILPAGDDGTERLDVYAVERKYWESLWYRPQ
ncbi:MAG: hypothetical protein GY953_03790 [bacterium]|nr:hypothetical protein [bacterium]